MTWQSHALLGINSLWLIAFVSHGITSSNISVLVILAVFGSLFPDLDAQESKLKHLRIGGIEPLAPVASLLHRSLGHRGLLHSLAGGTVIIALAIIPALWGWQFAAALILGYVSHLFGDACTPSGIPFWFPDPRRYHLLPKRWRIITGSWTEEALLPFLIALAALLLLTHLPINQ